MTVNQNILTDKNWFKTYNQSLSTLDYVFISLFVLALGTRGVMPQAITEISIWCISIYYLIRDRTLTNLKIYQPWTLPFVSVIFYIVLNAIIMDVDDFGTAIYYFLIFIPFIIFFNSYDRCRAFIILSGILSLLICVLLLAYYFFGIDSFESLVIRRSGSSRAIGLMGNPNYFGYYCFAIFLATQLVNFKYKHIISIALIILILLSISRGIMVGLIIYFLFTIFKKVQNLIIFITITALVLYNLDLLLPDNFADNFLKRVLELGSEDAGSGRSSIWTKGLQIWSNTWGDIIFGFGFNNFKSRLTFMDIDNTVHNSYLRMMFEFGILGFILIMNFFRSVIKSISWLDLRTMLTFIFSIMAVWLSNDFFINKETFYLSAICICIFNFKSKIIIT